MLHAGLMQAHDEWPALLDYAVAAGDLDMLDEDGPTADDMAAERLERDRAVWQRAEAIEPPTLRAIDEAPDLREMPGYQPGDVAVDAALDREADAHGFPAPVDCGHLELSAFGGIEYIKDLIIPGRIHVVAAQEGTGKTYAMYELVIRTSVAGGAFAGTFPIEVAGPCVYLSEMHVDDDWRYQQDILDSLATDRAALSGNLFRLDLGTAAHGQPVLTDPVWRDWFTRWSRRRGIRLAVFDTATGASQVDPWGKNLQQIYRDLRVMLAEYPELSVVLLLHLKKPPQGGRRVERGISDVLGEWARWCDVLVLMENEGEARTKLSTHKRLRHHKRIVATRLGGLLIDPRDITDAKPEKKVKPKDQLATIDAHPGSTYAELADIWKVSKETARKWCQDLGVAILMVSGERKTVRVHRQPPNDRQVSAFGGDLVVDTEVTANRQEHPLGEGALALGGRDHPDVDEDLAERATDDDAEAAS